MTTTQRQIGTITRTTCQSEWFATPCLEVCVDEKRLRYVATNPHSVARVETLFEKEPTTIPWIETFESGQTFVDIGANVGMYSIYAAVMTGCSIFAFEPESLNYADLNKNIVANGLQERAFALCMAISDEEKVDYLNLGCFGAAYSHHDFAENTWVEDKWFGDKVTRKDARLRQGSVSSTLDLLVERGVVPVPDHVKVDVDGIEYRVFAGARNTFADPRVQTVLMEISFVDARNAAIIDSMTEMGWRYSWAQLRTNRKKILTAEYIERSRRNHRGGFNYIFFRDDRYENLFEDYLAGFQPPWAHKVAAPVSR
jgi:FkbM family methyltransferase